MNVIPWYNSRGGNNYNFLNTTMIVLWFIKASLLKREASIYTQTTATHSISQLYVGISGSYSGSHVYMPESQPLCIYTYLKFRNDLQSAYNQVVFMNMFLMLRSSFHDKCYKWPPFTWLPLHHSNIYSLMSHLFCNHLLLEIEHWYAHMSRHNHTQVPSQSIILEIQITIITLPMTIRQLSIWHFWLWITSEWSTLQQWQS